MTSPPKVRFGSSNRKSMALVGTKDIPGPDRYDVSTALALKKANPKTIFGSSKRQPLNLPNSNPAPGDYKIPSKAIEGRANSLYGRKFID